MPPDPDPALSCAALHPPAPSQRSVLVRGGAWEVADSLSELGVYGVFLRQGDTVLLNAEVRQGRAFWSLIHGTVIWSIPR